MAGFQMLSSGRLWVIGDNMRKSFDTLAALVQEVLQQNPLSGHLFVFRSKRGDRVKILYWNTHGYALWYTRLERGTFRFPAADADQNATCLRISATDLGDAARWRGTGQRHASPPLSTAGGRCELTRAKVFSSRMKLLPPFVG